MSTKQKNNFARGDIVLIPFPFTDLSHNKLRPSVVVASDREDMVVVFLTSIKPKDKHHILINPSEANGLKTASYLRYNKIATLDKKISLGVLGKLEPKAHNELVDKIINYILKS